MLLGPLLGIKEDSLICTLCTSSHQSSSKAQAPVFRSPDLISFAWKSYGIIFLNYIWISHWDKWIWDILNFRICLLRTRWAEGLCRLSWPLHFHLMMGPWKPCHAGVAMVGMKNLWKNERSKMIQTLSIHILPYSILNIVPWFEYVVNLF